MRPIAFAYSGCIEMPDVGTVTSTADRGIGTCWAITALDAKQADVAKRAAADERPTCAIRDMASAPSIVLCELPRTVKTIAWPQSIQHRAYLLSYLALSLELRGTKGCLLAVPFQALHAS